MERRRTAPRPASNEEIEVWGHAAESLSSLSKFYSSAATADTIGRVNRLINAWPTDDTLPSEGLVGLKTVHQKLTTSLNDLMSACDNEMKAIDEATEHLNIIIALRKAPEAAPSGEKRSKRPRAPSPGTPAPTPMRSVSITVPPRTNSVGPTGHFRDKEKRGSSLKPQPLQPGRKVAFKPPLSQQDESTQWILALVKRHLGGDKHGPKYEVQDAEPQEDGQPGTIYTANMKSLLPLPEPDAAPSNPSHISHYPEFPAGAIVMALYPDTSCFYRAEVIARTHDKSSAARIPMYKVKFEDDEDMEHSVSAYWVVENPPNAR